MKEKFAFGAPFVGFFGYFADTRGTRPTAEKQRAIRETPESKNKTKI